MKKNFFLSFLLIPIFFCGGCVSSSAEKTGVQIQNEASVQVQSDSDIEENVAPKKNPRFTDWKYKGFGKTLPDWAEFAVDDDFSALKKVIPEFSDETKIKIVKGFGVNYDQAEQSAKTTIKNENPDGEGFILFDNFWVKFDDERKNDSDLKTPYVSFYLFYKNL